MQYYTRQQLQGSMRYADSVLLGNWNEDRCVKETVLQDFLAKADSSSLKIDHFQKRMARALAPADLTVVRDDGLVHFGDVVQLAHAGEAKVVLATDIHDSYMSPRLDISTTHYNDDVLHYGQKFRLVANPAERAEALDAGGGKTPLCLFSKLVGPMHFAKYSHHQIAGFTTRTNYDAVFMVVPPNPADRIASEGVEVLAGAPLCVQHCATSALLCLEPSAHPNEFGTEREVSFKTVQRNGKKLLLVHEAHGELSATVPSTRTPANQFCFIVGNTIKELPAPQTDALEVNDILGRANGGLLQSTLGCAGFRQKLLRLDTDGSGKVHASEVQLAFSYAGVHLAASEVAALSKHFGTTQTDIVDARALLAQLEMLDPNAQH